MQHGTTQAIVADSVTLSNDTHLSTLVDYLSVSLTKLIYLTSHTWICSPSILFFGKGGGLLNLRCIILPGLNVTCTRGLRRSEFAETVSGYEFMDEIAAESNSNLSQLQKADAERRLNKKQVSLGNYKQPFVWYSAIDTFGIPSLSLSPKL